MQKEEEDEKKKDQLAKRKAMRERIERKGVMKKTTIEQLNSAAMQIILHAGDCRNLLNEAVNALLEDKSEEDIKAKITAAKKEITKAHVIQTEMIQSSINGDELQTTLLFTHAQDTLMTINSEVNLTQNMIRLYRKLEK